MPPIQAMYPLIKALKSNGYSIYLLSNCPEWLEDFKPSVPALQFFDGFVISSDYHQIKPDEAIYRTLFEKFNLIAEECFFIDDNPLNVAAGVKLGMYGHCFDDRDINKLKKLSTITE